MTGRRVSILLVASAVVVALVFLLRDDPQSRDQRSAQQSGTNFRPTPTPSDGEEQIAVAVQPEKKDPPAAQTAVVRGTVRFRDGSPIPRRCVVRVTDRATRLPVAEVPTDAGGAFEAELDVSTTRRLMLVAHATDGEDHWVSHPGPIEVSPTTNAPQAVTLYLIPGCLVTARVVDSRGMAVPRAHCLLTQLSHTSLRRSKPPTNLDAYRTLDEVVRADSDGVLTAIVREGHFELRASRDLIAFGRSKRILAPSHGTLDAGLLHVPALVLPLTLTVTGPGEQPVAQAWVRLSDRCLRFGNPQERGEVAHLWTNDAGKITLNIAREHLPLRGAVGSPEHFVEEVIWDEAIPDVTVVLRPRPKVELTVRSTAGDVLPVDAQWFVKRLDGKKAASNGFKGPVNVLRMHCAVHRQRSVRPGVTSITLASPGRYLFRSELPGGLVLEAKATATSGTQQLAVEAKDATPITLNLRNPPPRDVRLRITGTPPGSREPFRFTVTLKRGTTRIVCWTPKTISEWRVACREPFGEWTVSGSEVEIDLDAQRSNCTLIASKADARLLIRLPSGVVRKVTTDETGVARLRLGPGEYRVTREPASQSTWYRFTVSGRSSARVVVPRDR